MLKMYKNRNFNKAEIFIKDGIVNTSGEYSLLSQNDIDIKISTWVFILKNIQYTNINSPKG